MFPTEMEICDNYKYFNVISPHDVKYEYDFALILHLTSFNKTKKSV